MTQFQHDFFADSPTAEPSALGQRAGSIGSWLLHIAKVTFLIYSGVHGVMASLHYAAENPVAQLAQIAGIVITEAVLFGLYLAWHNQRITGAAQSIAAGATYASGFLLATLGIIADSQANAGVALSPVLSFYLTWGLPIAPALMALGALLTHELAPQQLQARQQATAVAAHRQAAFQAHMAAQKAELEAKKALANMQLNARHNVVAQIASAYNAPQVQAAITQTAVANLPQLLASAGIQPLAETAESEHMVEPHAHQAAEPVVTTEHVVEPHAHSPVPTDNEHHLNGAVSGDDTPFESARPRGA